MYIKYVTIDNETVAGLGHVMTSIYGILNGDKTSASDFHPSYCDIEASQVVGTIPNRAALWEYTGSTTNQTESAYRRDAIKKHHSVVTSSDTSYDPRVMLSAMNYSVYGLGMTIQSHNGTNGFTPRWDEGFILKNNNDNDLNLFKPFTGQVFHFFITDKIFFMSTTNENDVTFTFGMLEQEYSAGFDEKLFETNPLWCPTILFKSRFSNLEKDDVDGTGVMAMGKTQYVTQSGTSGNTELNLFGYARSAETVVVRGNMAYGGWKGIWDAGKEHGVFVGQNAFGMAIPHNDYRNIEIEVDGTMPSIFPSPSTQMPGQAGDAGSSVHKLHPIYYQPTMFAGSAGTLPNREYDTKFGKIEDIYRTSDSVLNTGDVLTDGTNNFRIIRLHHNGETTGDSNGFAACYAIPE